jgi:hypothetical protein
MSVKKKREREREKRKEKERKEKTENNRNICVTCISNPASGAKITFEIYN